MNEQVKRFLLLMGCAAMLAACTVEEEQFEPEEQEEIDEHSYDFGSFDRFTSTSPAEWMQAEPGDYHTEDFDDEEVLEILRESADLGVSDEELFYQMLDLAAFDYRDDYTYFMQFDEIQSEIASVGANLMDEGMQVNIHLLYDANIGTDADDEVLGLLQDFMQDMPDDTNVSLLSYGAEAESGERSCDSIHEIHPLDSYDERLLQEGVGIEPGASVPLSSALNEVEVHYSDYEKTIVYVVASGADTCGGDPAHAAEMLDAVVHVIGYNVDPNEREALESVASSSEGTFTHVEEVEGFQRVIQEASIYTIQAWRDWQVEFIEDKRAQQMEHIDDSRERQDEMNERTREEQDRLRHLTDQLEEEGYRVNGAYIRSMINERAVSLRTYMFETAIEFRDEAFQASLDPIEEDQE
ncbi:D-amino acid dehydrogenase large subunit [Geomicrobium sp. JCM 19037]|nr:D-amino acid dehydrogenase large subunit [Geomicrobium sp. JCM 19037]